MWNLLEIGTLAGESYTEDRVDGDFCSEVGLKDI